MQDKLRHLPEKTRSLLIKYTDMLVEIFGENLYSLILFGSAARASKRNGDDFKEGASDVNTVIILEEVTTLQLNIIIDIGRKLKGKGLAVPLIFKRGHILSSLDTFPLEFSDMKHNHIILHGANPLENAEIETNNLRHQCEVEFKGQLVQLRRAYLAASEDQDKLTELLSTSVTSITAACRGMVLIAGKTPPENKSDLLKLVHNDYNVDTSPIIEALRIKHRESGGATAALESLFDNYMTTIENLADVVDGL